MNSQINTLGLASVCAVGMLAGLYDDRGIAAERPSQARVIQPDPELQRQLRGVMHVLTDQRATLEDQFRAVGSLSEAARDDEHFFGQLLHLYWQVDASPDRQQMKELWTIRMIPMLDISRIGVAKVVIPFLDAQDERQRNTAKRFLGLVEETGVPDCLNFSYFEPLLQPDAPLELARYMFQRDASEAFREFIIAYMSPPVRPLGLTVAELRWADHIVSDAIKKGKFVKRFSASPGGPREAVVALEKLAREEAAFQLEKLSKSDDWWVRVYVAEIMRQHPAFRRPDIVARLDKDAHPLVREAMGFVQQQQPPPGRTAPKESPFGPPPSPRAEKGK